MKALTTLKSAISQPKISIIILLALTPGLMPHIALGADIQTSGAQSQIFEIKVADSNLIKTNDNQNSLSYDTLQQTDPLFVNLQAYLQDHNSPLQGYTGQLLGKDNWKTIVAISFVESNMCVHHLNYNCSGIGGPGHFYAFKDFGGWIDCMSNLLDTRYNGWTLDKMNGIYVQPRSTNWGYGSQKVLNELTQLEKKSNETRIAMSQSAIKSSVELATIAQ